MTVWPTIALLIPAYNAARYLPRLLASAHAQTEPFDEIWVYDDCSADETAAVAVSHGAKVLRGLVNLGCSAGKNALAQRVLTDFIHFHDADDELLPNFLALARKWIDRGAPDVVLFAYEYSCEATGALLSVATFDDADPRHGTSKSESEADGFVKEYSIARRFQARRLTHPALRRVALMIAERYAWHREVIPIGTESRFVAFSRLVIGILKSLCYRLDRFTFGALRLCAIGKRRSQF